MARFGTITQTVAARLEPRTPMIRRIIRILSAMV